MIYEFIDCGIDKLKVFEKGEVARSLVFTGLTADVEGLFSDLL